MAPTLHNSRMLIIPVELRPSRVHGLGVFTRQAVRAGEVVSRYLPPFDVQYPNRRREEARRNAIRFLNREIKHLWPAAVRRSGQFRWDLLVDPAEEAPPAADDARGAD